MLVVARVTHEIPVEQSLKRVLNDNYIYVYFFFSVRVKKWKQNDSQFVSTDCFERYFQLFKGSGK